MAYYQGEVRTAGGAYAASQATENARIDFIRKTYAHLGGAVLAFAALEALIFNADRFLGYDLAGQMTVTMLASSNAWIVVLLLFMAIGGMAKWWANPSRSLGMQYFGLFIYVVAEALIFVPLLYLAQYYSKQPNIIRDAGIVTAAVFGGLTFFVFFTKKDFSFMRNFLIVCSMAAIALVFSSLFFGFELGMVFSVAMVVLASGYILYHTSNILHHYPPGAHVAAALALFSAVALLFWYIIRIFMNRR